MFDKRLVEQNAAALEMDIQREEVLAFFRDYWKPLLAFAVFLIFLTAGIQIYRNVEANTASQEMSELSPLVAAPATVESAKALEDYAAKKASGNRKSLALLYAAGKYQTANKLEDMRRVLNEIAASSASSALKDYARVLAANAGDAEAVNKIGKDSAWSPAVQEFNALAEKDAQRRRELYGKIADDKNTPQAMRRRAAEFSGQAAE